MNNPTDTNQASEDDLKQYLHEMHHRIMGDYDGDPYEEHPYQDEAKPYFWEGEAKRLQQLIRTEKLKLLAEVREQQIPVIALKAKKPHDEVQIRAVPIESLNKLEAEI